MSISAINKTALAWLGAAAGCAAVSNIYALFGHGLRSAAMDWMFLYPLLGGVVSTCLTRKNRLAANLCASGIAALTAGAMLRGILEIAGTASAYTFVFSITGWVFASAGIVAALAANRREHP